MATSAVPVNSGGGVSRPGNVRQTGFFRSAGLHRWLRTFHRVAALIAGIFMVVVGLTGALEGAEQLFGPPGAHGGNGYFSTTVHFTIMDLHSMFIFGKGVGLALELLITFSLVLFSVSGLWFYAVLFRQWLKLATKNSGGYAPSTAFRAANRFMAWFTSLLLAVCVFLAIASYIDWLVSRPASIAANRAGLPPPTPTFYEGTKLFLELKGNVILNMAAGLAILYFCVVGLWYSGLVFAGWRRSRAARVGKPAEPGKAMRTIHRWISVPFGLYMIVMAATGAASIPGLWGAGHLPFLSSPSHLKNLKTEAEEARIATLPPEQQAAALAKLKARNSRGGGGGGGGGGGEGARAGGQGGGEGARANRQQGGEGARGPRGAEGARASREQGGEGARAGGQRDGEGARANRERGGEGARAGGQGGAEGARAGGRGNARPQRDRSMMPFYGKIQQSMVHDFHTGAAFGVPGQVFVIFLGLALAMFSLSGIWMYCSMYMPRRQSGRKGLIWH